MKETEGDEGERDFLTEIEKDKRGNRIFKQRESVWCTSYLFSIGTMYIP